jgi:hypothetical protein
VKEEVTTLFHSRAFTHAPVMIDYSLRFATNEPLVAVHGF